MGWKAFTLSSRGGCAYVVPRKYLKGGVDHEAIAGRFRVIAEASDVTEIDVETAMEAAKSYVKLLGGSGKGG